MLAKIENFIFDAQWLNTLRHPLLSTVLDCARQRHSNQYLNPARLGHPHLLRRSRPNLLEILILGLLTRWSAGRYKEGVAALYA